MKTNRAANAPVGRPSTTSERAAAGTVLPTESNSEEDEFETFDSFRNVDKDREKVRESNDRRPKANPARVYSRNRTEARETNNSGQLIDSFENEK